MRSLKNKPQVASPTSTYPHGRIRDDNGSGNFGTPVDEQVYGDFHQFFSQLMVDGGVTPNEIAENEYDGFQLNTALGNWINNLAEKLYDLRKSQDVQWGAWQTISMLNSWVAGSLPPQYRINNKTGIVYFRGFIAPSTSSSSTVIASGLPTPSSQYDMPVSTDAGTYANQYRLLTMSPNGQLTAWNNGAGFSGNIYLNNLFYHTS